MFRTETLKWVATLYRNMSTDIDTRQAFRKVHVRGLLEDGTQFMFEMDVDNNSSVEAAVSNCLTMNGVNPASVDDFRAAYIERRVELDIPEDLYR